jgi:hypothetical protein
MTVMVAEDRSMCVQPYQVERTAWVDIDLCKLGSRLPMSPEAVEKKFRRLLNIGDCAPWPPIVGHWEDGRFLVDDGRHDYLAALMMGREKLFVCWLEEADATAVGKPHMTAVEPPQDASGRLASAADRAALVPSTSTEPKSRRNLWPRRWLRRCNSTLNDAGELDFSSNADPLPLLACARSQQ